MIFKPAANPKVETIRARVRRLRALQVESQQLARGLGAVRASRFNLRTSADLGAPVLQRPSLQVLLFLSTISSRTQERSPERAIDAVPPPLPRFCDCIPTSLRWSTPTTNSRLVGQGARCPLFPGLRRLVLVGLKPRMPVGLVPHRFSVGSGDGHCQRSQLSCKFGALRALSL